MKEIAIIVLVGLAGYGCYVLYGHFTSHYDVSVTAPSIKAK